jgi:hypothetical protein
MNHKAGDTVRIQSRKWIDALERDNAGDSKGPDKEDHWFLQEMLPHCGKIAKIMGVRTHCYLLDIDDGYNTWEDWMFDPDYRPDEPLSPEDAIRAMLDGETLVTAEGHDVRWREDIANFERTAEGVIRNGLVFAGLRRPEKRKRQMTRWEILVWASGEESRGWVVTDTAKGPGYWYCPQGFEYDGGNLKEYRRAKLLPDGSGIDESTIQGFEVEE